MNHHDSLKGRFALQEAIEQFSTHLISPIEKHYEFFLQIRISHLRTFQSRISAYVPPFPFLDFLFPPFFFFLFVPLCLSPITLINTICIVHRFRWRCPNCHSVEKNEKKKTLLPSALASSCGGGDMSPPCSSPGARRFDCHFQTVWLCIERYKRAKNE